MKYACTTSMLPAPVSGEQIAGIVSAVLGNLVKNISVALGEVTLIVSAANYLAVAALLRDAEDCKLTPTYIELK